MRTVLRFLCGDFAPGTQRCKSMPTRPQPSPHRSPLKFMSICSTKCFSNMIPIRSTLIRCDSMQPALSTARRRLACSQSKPSTQCPSKAAASLSLSSTQFWSSAPIWKRAGINTLRCLIGCTAGDFSAMWYLQSFHADLGISTIMALSST